MEDFGKRLKEERERLGLSQARFAELCGVGRTAQFNYERGERHPASVYLDAAEKLGVDIHYVFTATRKGNDWAYSRAFSRMLYTFEWLLGLEERRLEAIARELVDLNEKADWFNDSPNTRPDCVSFQEWLASFRDWLGTAAKLDHCVDVALLSQLIDAVSLAADKVGATLSTEKRLRAALMLYREAKRCGGIEQRQVDDAVRLAA
ncbi:MAG: helix-turn-helix transcriptional regulator [Zoogloeaceae bacterium]|nr:helix-turn-helix transcriptional regulator [Zoogloeaceae bacterium]